MCACVCTCVYVCVCVCVRVQVHDLYRKTNHHQIYYTYTYVTVSRKGGHFAQNLHCAV